MKIFLMGALLLISTNEAFASNVGIPASPFEKNKLLVNQSSVANNKAMGNSIATVATDPKLIALMDMDCSAKKGINSLLKFKADIEMIDNTPSIKTHRKVFKLSLKKSVSDKRLSEFANSSECLIGITNDVEYHTTDTFNDPSFNLQTQHSLLHTEDFYNKANWIPMEDQNRAVIAVIDTGVDFNHPDLSNMMFRKDGQVVGVSFVPGNPSFYDDHGHGTHVSGLAAAEADNGVGGVGVCGKSCFIMPVKVLNAKGAGYSSDIANGVFWAVDNGANVLNMSLGRSLNFLGMAPIDLEAFRYAMLKNVVVAVAAGNDGAILTKDGSQSWPAMFGELPGLITVASLDAATGALSTFSNRSSRYVEIGAPGSTSSTNGKYVGLVSTAPGGGYASMSGTSMATPVVAGSIGLIISYYKKFNILYNVWDIEAFLKSSAVTNNSLKTFIEAGRVLDLSVLADKLQGVHDSTSRLNPANPLESFVIDLYYVIMRRAYDPDGAQFTLDLIKKSHFSLESIILSFFNSPEFSSNFGKLYVPGSDVLALTMDHLVPDAYLTILGHLPTKEEGAYWVNYLTVYKNKLRTFVRVLLGSEEFQTRIKGTNLSNYPIMEKLASDANARCRSRSFKGDYSFEKQIDFGYCMILERAADSGGRLFYVELLKKGLKLEEIYKSMYLSAEFKDMNQTDKMTDREYVNMLYYTMLERMPQPHESYYWIDILTKRPREEVMNAFVYSAEFNQILKTRGIIK